jgi:hypothetical protein
VTRRSDAWLAALVIGHFLVNLAHGAAHARAGVGLGRGQAIFVAVVILAGPFVGLGLSWFRPRAGAWLIAATMGAALAFGVINHFLVVSPDQVGQVAEAWRPQFGSTAILLVVFEAAGALVALRRARRPRELST